MGSDLPLRGCHPADGGRSALGCSPDRTVCPAHGRYKVDALSCGSPPLRSSGIAARHCAIQPAKRLNDAAASPEVSFPSALSARRSDDSSRVCLTRVPAPTGFLDPLTPCSPSRPARLFHRADTHGIHPSEVFSSARVDSPLDEPAPACRSSRSGRRLSPSIERPPRAAAPRLSPRAGSGSRPHPP